MRLGFAMRVVLYRWCFEEMGTHKLMAARTVKGMEMMAMITIAISQRIGCPTMCCHACAVAGEGRSLKREPRERAAGRGGSSAASMVGVPPS